MIPQVKHMHSDKVRGSSFTVRTLAYSNFTIQLNVKPLECKAIIIKFAYVAMC